MTVKNIYSFFCPPPRRQPQQDANGRTTALIILVAAIAFTYAYAHAHASQRTSSICSSSPAQIGPAQCPLIQPSSPSHPDSNLCQDPQLSYLCANHLGYPRDPAHLSSSDPSSLIQTLRENAIPFEECSVPAHYLTASQKEITRNKTMSMLEFWFQGRYDACKDPILVSSDSDGRAYVLDGHHRFAACSLAGGDQRVIAISTKDIA